MEDWKRARVGDVAAPGTNSMATGPFGSSIGSKFFRTSGVPVIRGGNLSTDSTIRISDSDLVFLTPEKAAEFTRSTVRRGDLIFTCWGTINQVGLIDECASYDEYVISNKQMKLTPDPRVASSEYLYYLFSSPAMQRQILGGSIGSSIPGFNLTRLRSIEIQLPPIGEQKQIARALSDAEHLETTLRRLIAKKQAIRQGMMQELLSGKTRLPGFSEPWIKRTAGAIGLFKGGSGFPVRFQGEQSGQYPYFKVSDMNSPGNEVFMKTANNYVNEEQREEMGAVRMPEGAIVFAKVGGAVFLERKRILAQTSCIDNNMTAFAVDSSKTDVRFVHYLLTTFPMASLVATTALPSLNGGQLRSIPLKLPFDPEEQRAIACTLSEVDCGIDRLRARLTKVRNIKTGMMQELLTGRTRLVAREVPA